MTKEQINQLGLNAAREQRIAADDRHLQAVVDLQIAKQRIAELEAQIAAQSVTAGAQGSPQSVKVDAMCNVTGDST